ncbi:heterokaryon incompatibility protein-domain-containing protein [Hypoxylon sp. FL1857]|nr:heterokaryon incompatibility protein-domain-containing protein [Hypoxylon sp. FL1857]
MCCSVCGCLGFCDKSPWDGFGPSPRGGLAVFASRTYDDIKDSAHAGCEFCDLACQAYKLLDYAASKPEVNIHVHQDSAAEILAITHDRGDESDSIQIFACTEKPVAFKQFGREVPARPDSDESFHFLKSSYDSCLEHHPDCQQTSSILPKRLVDISKSPNRLVEPGPGARAQYAALSYRWGHWKSFTTKDNVESHKREIDPKSEPTVFQEAATVARKLGIDYLWIDSICIIQDDNEDWAAEAAKMAQVYENASVVIAASSVFNPGMSFLTHRASPFESSPLNFKGSSTIFRARKRPRYGLHSKPGSLKKDPLDIRAWVLQEEQLARRRISYSSSEVQWKCKTIESCECRGAPQARQSSLFGPKVSQSDLHHDWNQIVKEYTSRQLTRQSDRLPALIGLARKFESITSGTYIAGMWQDNLIEDMVWKRDGDAGFRPPDQLNAPSFSWASILGSISYQPGRWGYRGTREYHSRLLHVHIPATADGLDSGLESGFVVLQGPVMNATLSSPKPEEPGSYRLTVGDRHYFSEVIAFDEGLECTCEFTIDLPLTIHHDRINEGYSRRASRSLKPGDTLNPVDFVPVKLLSLYSLIQSSGADVYENFLILGQRANPSQHEEEYERIGIGTGKVFLQTGDLSLSKLDTPFRWVPDNGTLAQETAQGLYRKEVIRIG